MGVIEQIKSQAPGVAPKIGAEQAHDPAAHREPTSLELPQSEFRDPLRAPNEAPKQNPTAVSAVDLAAEYRGEISRLKASGIELKFAPGFTTGEDQLQASSALNARSKFSEGATADPIRQLRYTTATDAELPPELRSGAPGFVYPLKLESSADSPTQGTVRVINYLCNSDKPVYETKVALEHGMLKPEDRQRVEQEFLKVYRENREAMHAAFNDAVATKAKAFPQVVGLNPQAALGEPEQRALGQLLQGHGFRMFATYQPDGSAVDRYISAGELSKNYHLSITPEILERSKGSRIDVRGEVPEIALSRSVRIDACTTTPGTNDIATINGQPVLKEFTDRYGNLVTCVMSANTLRSVAQETIIIQPPMVGAVNQDLRPIKVDLSSLGLGEIPAIFARQPLRALPRVHGREVLTNMDAEKLSPDHVRQLAGVCDGVSKAEAAFGAMPGVLANRIALLNSERPNAFFNRKDPSTIVIQDEILNSAVVPEVVGFHETSHLVDGRAGFQLSGGQFREQFQKLSREKAPILGAINESAFMPGVTLGGHAEQNHLELFASVCNTLQLAAADRAGWERKVSGFTPEMRKDYRDILAGLQATFNSAPDIAGAKPFRESPLAAIVDDRIRWLDEHR